MAKKSKETPQEIGSALSEFGSAASSLGIGENVLANAILKLLEQFGVDSERLKVDIPFWDKTQRAVKAAIQTFNESMKD